MEITQESITFGKYKDLPLPKMLRDRKYCSWLLQQEWFKKSYEYLFNRVSEYNPKINFLPILNESKNVGVLKFIDEYIYFHLKPIPDIVLTDNEKKCYEYYLYSIKCLEEKIIDNNSYDIKAPTSWLNKFEKKYGLSRDIFKEFLEANELPNIPYIVEDIKKMGGIEYKGAKSFLIAKEKSLNQEKFWEILLKKIYGEEISSQYKFKHCFFDFIHIKSNVVYECKLGLKDFDIEQFNKYMSTIGHFTLVYLIGNDGIIDLDKKTIYTTNEEYYKNYIEKFKLDDSQKITKSKNRNSILFDRLISNFTIISLKDIENYFMNKFNSS